MSEKFRQKNELRSSSCLLDQKFKMLRLARIGGLLAASCSASFSFIQHSQKNVSANSPSASLPSYSLQDVTKHNSKQCGYWVCFKNGVYDVTNFVNEHSGGPAYIELASGGRLEPFWAIFKDHTQHDSTLHLLESMRIGNLNTDDQLSHNDISTLSTDAFQNEPNRDSKMECVSQFPCIAESPTEHLSDDIITPNQLFYVRNHFPVPTHCASDHVLHLHLSGIQVCIKLKKKHKTQKKEKRLPLHGMSIYVI